MLTSKDLLYGIVVPFALSALILLIAWRPWKRTGASPALWGGPVAGGLAFVTTFAALQGPRHVLVPGSAILWLFYIGVGFTLLGVIDGLLRLPQVVRAITVLVATGAAATVLLRFNFSNQTWDAMHGALWLGGIATVAVIWWASFEQAATGGAITGPLAMAAFSGVSGLIVALLVEQTTGQALGAMAIAFIVAVALLAWSRRASVERGTAMVLAGVGACALAGEYFISSLPIQYILLIAVAPLMLWIGRIPAIRRSRPWLGVVIQMVALLVPLGIAAGMAVVQARNDATMGGDPYMSLAEMEQTFA